jgi:hypothetical protein
MVKRDVNAHSKALDVIINNPSDFGIHGVKGVAKEIVLYKEGGRKINLTDIDILFYLRDEVVIVEYTSNGNRNSKSEEKALEQVTKSATWFAKNTPYGPGQIHTKIISGSDPQYSRMFNKDKKDGK